MVLGWKKMIYNYFSYGVIIFWLFSVIASPKYIKVWFFIPILVVISLPVFSGLSAVDYLYSIFSQPSVLMTSLAIYSIAMSFFQKLNCNRLCESISITSSYNLPYEFWLITWVMNVGIIVSSMGIDPLNFYHKINMPNYQFVNFGIFGIYFISIYLISKKTLFIAYAVLLCYLVGIMNTTHILDYISDFCLWLLCSILLLVKAFKRKKV